MAEILEDCLAPAVFYVNSTADVLNPAPGIVTLRSAIEAANATAGDNTINVTEPGTYRITQAGTAGETDNAAGEFAIFSTVLSTVAAITSLTIVNTSGGVVIVDGNHLARVFDVNPSLQLGSVNIAAGGTGFTSASGITFSAPTLAGGIQATGTLILSGDSVIGVMITNPGTGYTESAPPTITFTGPGAGAAGNIVLASPAINVSMAGFTVQNGVAQPGDLAAGSGGGIRSVGHANLTLTNMVVTSNSAIADGGGVAVENSSGGTDFLGGSTFGALTINNSTISNNHAGDAGGGVDFDGWGAVNINAGTISGNTAVKHGAGVSLDGIANSLDGVAMLGGSSGYTSAPIVNFSGPGTGAAAFATVVNGVVTSVTLINSGTGYTSRPTITFVGGGGFGAAARADPVPSESPNLTMTGTLVSSNTATGSVNGRGGGISNAGLSLVTITSSTIAGNSAAATGGGYSEENNGLGTLNISDSLFLNNTAMGNGGAIFVNGQGSTPTHTFITTTTITNTEVKGNTSNANGGGLFDSGTILTVMNVTFTGNISSGNGGGLEFETTGAGDNSSAITNTTITGNSASTSAGGNGGGIDAPAAFTGSLTLQDDTINGSFAAVGGGISWAGTTGSSITVQNTIIANNTAATGPDADNAVGSFTDNGGNLIGVSGPGSGNTGFTAASTQTGTVASPLNPKLGPPKLNGGPTVGATVNSMILETEALLPTSPAINTGVIAGAPRTDERGLDRSVNGIIDIGAYEIQQMDIAGEVIQNGDVWVGVSSGSSFANTLFSTFFPNWVDVLTGDFNGDGLTDYVARDPQTGLIWVALAAGSPFGLTPPHFDVHLWGAWNPTVTWVDVRVGDFTGDGRPDLVGRVAETGQIWVATSTGSSFTNSLWTTWAPSVTWADVKVGDFTGDGKADLAGRVQASGDWWVAQSSGSSFTNVRWTTWDPSVTWVDVQVGDFTGDGKADIAGRDQANGAWWVAVSSGSSFANTLWTIWAPNVTWLDVRVGDFNGDDKADLVGRVSANGQIWVAKSTGSSFTNSLWAAWDPSVSWVDVQAGDFNGDSFADIAGRNMATGDWWVGLSNGSTAFNTTLWTTWNPEVTWTTVFNGDYE